MIIKLNPQVTVRVADFHYTPATPDVWYMPNGDPGYPGDPEELSVNKVELQLPDGSWLDVTGFWSAMAEAQEFNDPVSSAVLDLIRKVREDDDHA